MPCDRKKSPPTELLLLTWASTVSIPKSTAIVLMLTLVKDEPTTTLLLIGNRWTEQGGHSRSLALGAFGLNATYSGL